MHVLFAFIETVFPIVILRAFYEDSMFWQGLYTGQTSLIGPDMNTGNLNEPLLGVWSMSRRTVGLIADTLDTLDRQVSIPLAAHCSLCGKYQPSVV
jgi:hypothetical protein